MKPWLGPALGGLALVVASYSVVSTWSLHNKIDALQQAPAASVAMAPRGVGPDGDTVRSAVGARRAERMQASRSTVDGPPPADARPGTASFDLSDPELRDQLMAVVEEEERIRREERHAERSEAFMQSMRDELDVFAEERGIDEDVRGQVLVELERRHEEFSALRHDTHEGTVSRFDARREMEAMMEESDAVLQDLLGSEDAEALNERLWGGRRGGPPGPPPH